MEFIAHPRNLCISMQMFLLKGEKETSCSSELVDACLFLGSLMKVRELTTLEQIASHPTMK